MVDPIKFQMTPELRAMLPWAQFTGIYDWLRFKRRLGLSDDEWDSIHVKAEVLFIKQQMKMNHG